MKRIVIPCFLKSILTKFFCSVRPSIVSIIRNHPTDAMKRCEKNAYEKIAILCKCADDCTATSLTFYSSVCVFFFFLGFLSRTFTFHRTAGKGEGYLFNSSVLLPPASRTRTGNLFPTGFQVQVCLSEIKTIFLFF